MIESSPSNSIFLELGNSSSNVVAILASPKSRPISWSNIAMPMKILIDEYFSDACRATVERFRMGRGIKLGWISHRRVRFLEKVGRVSTGKWM